jgi:hypothetical protein
MYSDLHDYLVDYHLWPPGSVEACGILQHHTIRDLGITANDFTKGKRDLLGRGRLRPTPVTIGTQWPTQVLSKGKPKQRALEDLTTVLKERHRLLRPEQLGHAGEVYCRALFERLQRCNHFPIRDIPQKLKVGYESVKGLARRPDLRFRYTDRSGSEYWLLVENRNRRENTYPTNGKYFADLIRLALHMKALPILMASYLPDVTIEKCKRLGIATHVYNRQFIDSRLKQKVKKLYPDALHRELFQFVYYDQPFANYPHIDKRSLHDLDIIGKRSWIENAHKQWVKMKPYMPKIAEAFAKGKLYLVDTLLEDHV